MKPGQTFGAPWSGTLKIVTLFSVILLIGMILVGVFAFSNQQLPARLSLIILPPLILLGCALFMVRGYTVTEGQLMIHRLGWSSSLDLASLVSSHPGPIRHGRFDSCLRDWRSVCFLRPVSQPETRQLPALCDRPATFGCASFCRPSCCGHAGRPGDIRGGNHGRETSLHLNRQDEHRPAVLIKPPLQFKDSVVVQPARQETFVLEHQLPGEKL